MTDELYMQRCLELAEIGISSVSPNPMVGCVIVKDQKIIGEGYHAVIGQAHAEVNAVKDVIWRYGEEAAIGLIRDATVYVTLEPCAHFGKTPPCADLLIRYQVKKVVIGNKDPFADVDGKGIRKLKDAGVTIVQGVLEQACSKLNKRFLTRITKQRPYVILKWAQTANGFFAPLNPSQQWISAALSKKMVHKWRTEEDAVLVGKQTVLSDDPQLTTREWQGKNPLRLVIDKHLQLPLSKQVFNDTARTIIFNEVKTEQTGHLHYIQMEDMHFYLPQKIAYQLYLMDIQSVIIEGGANVLNQFIISGLWDEARVFNAAINWETGISAPQINGFVTEVIPLSVDKLIIYQNWKNQ